MGLFDFRKKNHEQEAKAADLQEKTAGPAEEMTADKQPEGDRWSRAHQAGPQGYQNADGTPFLVFTMTEGADTILPMDPRQMYKVKGKEIRDIRLGLVSADDGQVIGDLPYYLCSGVLSENAVESRPPFVLVRGMSLEEMNDLMDKVDAEINARQEMQELFAQNLDFLSRDEISKETVDSAFSGENLKQYTFEDVSYPTGELIAADPVSYLQDPDSVSYLRETIPAGKYPVTLGIFCPEGGSPRIAGMRLKVREEEAVSYSIAEDYRILDDEGTEGKGFLGFAVEAGMATFCDGQAAESYWDFLDEWEEEHPDGNFYDDCLAPLFAQSQEDVPGLQREDGDFIRFAVPGSDDEIIMAACGFGDGFYSVFWGRDASDNIVELVTVFIDPALFERMG